ncbi:MAG: ABC transporter ATP-binding protein [Acidobacteriia bacterium]|nr:ABC transporter ATP-binding protein [Terriglobia bacterium]
MTQVRLGRKIPPAFSLDVEFSIPPGVTALYGPPEAGKTLILESIAGLTLPDSGRILLDDAILFDAEAGVDVPARIRHCGYVGQHDALFPHMTLRQNVAFPARCWPRLERRRRVAEMIEKFQLTDAASSRPRELSPAQKLRGAIARALVGAPKLLLLDDRAIDEPLLREVRAASPAAVLLVARDLDLCCAAADQLIVLAAGRIAQRGAPRQVASQPESVDAARLLGYPNLFSGTIAALDPGRDSSRLEFADFALTGPYLPGHFRGDRVSAAIRAEDLRVHSGGLEPPPNSVSAQLVRVSHGARAVRLEFSSGIFADVSREEFARQKDNRTWQVEFPPEALRIIS